ncbi:MAG: hypothetical protein ACI4XN_12505 [Candidatus Kurthia intestinigallinarum]
MVKNRQCLACNTKYSYCPDCSHADKLAPSWKAMFCSEDCMMLWTTLTKFGMNKLTKSEAKSIISELDLKPIGTYVNCVQRDYAIVMADEKKTRKLQKKVELVAQESEQQEIVETVHEVVKQENE